MELQEMAFNVYHDPANVTIGQTPIAGVESIIVSVRRQEFHAAGDGEMHESVARFTAGRTSGAITLLDPAGAAAAAGRAGTLSFTWTDTKDQADKTVTIAGASIGGYDATVARNAASSVTLPFIAETAPVVTGQ
jgi:hypothetical protein